MIRSLLFAATLLASPALAQPACRPATDAFQELATKYKELPVFDGLSKRGHRIVALLNRETGSFTVLSVNAKGIACMIVSGEAGYARPIPPKGEIL